MRVLHVISTLDPAAGGPAEFVLTLLSHPEPGDTPEAVTLDAPGAPWLVGLPAHGLGPVRSTYGYSAKLGPWLRRNHARYHTVVVHGLWQFTGFSTALCLPQSTPYQIFAHGMLDPYFKRASRAKHLKKWVYWLLAEYWVLRGAHRVLFTTDEEARLARESFWLHRWRARTVPFGAMPPAPKTHSQVQSFLEVVPALRNRRFLLFLGRIHRKKGCDLLLTAFARVAAEDSTLDLAIAGPDQQNWAAELARLAVEAGIGDRVHWPGMLTGDAKWGAFRVSEAFILPSHQENFGIAVAEALACGKPVLLSDKINIAQEIAADHAGLVEADTLDGTERLLRRWIASSPGERETMASNALGCFERRYDLRKNIREIHRRLTPDRSA